MNITSAKEQIKDTVEAYLQKDDAGLFVIDPVHQRPVFLIGAPGIGKTAIIEQVARELEIGMVSYSMTHHTRQSALGLPRIEHRSFEGFEFEASEYTMSEIVAAIYDYMERTGLRHGILFLDEINCVSETLYPSMLQFLQFKTFGKHRVPDGWVVVCAGNPPEYNRSVHEFDIVTLDRMREIDVEPDYGAWRTYAQAKGLHPAVTTFLESKKDCFYKVESKPGGGKAFVTARGWEDLALIISLYESLGKSINRELIVQFLRDDAIADAFSVYYALFEKYRSDYQVSSILAGEPTDAIKNRAHEAPFDERIALLGLLIDALAQTCSTVLDQEALALEVRDVLRAAKPEFLAGASLDSALGERIAERERIISKKAATGVVSRAQMRKDRLVIDVLKGFVAACALQHAQAGTQAFEVIQAAYKEEVAKIEPLARTASEQMDHAFDFVDACFSSREMLVFMAELSTRQATTQFIARYGNQSYYAHNQELKVDAARMGLAERVSQLETIEEAIKTAEDSAPKTPKGVRESAVKLSVTPEANLGSPTASSTTERPVKATLSNAGEATALNASDLARHYHGKQFEYGFSSLCKMVLPVSELKGKTVLDMCCRRGKGAYKLSSMVGRDGHVLGIDWSEAYIQQAKDGMTRAWHDNGLPANNMEFRTAFPEDLIGAGIGNNTIDVVYVNNVISLFYDPKKTIEEFARVLKPGGMLIYETVFADRKRNEHIVAQAREIGNSIQASHAREDQYAWLDEAGFDTPRVIEEYEVTVDRGYKESSKVAIVEGDEQIVYTAATLYCTLK